MTSEESIMETVRVLYRMQREAFEQRKAEQEELLDDADDLFERQPLA